MNVKPSIYFISDLHLSFEKKELVQRFLDFLEHKAVHAQAVYILGDLFDSWIGDDDNTSFSQTIKQALSQRTQSGTQIFLQNGNRDFLIGSQFSQETGVHLLEDYHVMELGTERILLTHGDLLCSDDTAYQAFRQKSRSSEWQNNVLSKPLWLRLIAARWYRLRSHWHKRKKTQEIMDVNQQTVATIMQQFQCQQLIHGHTHRPATHPFILNDQPAVRHVLSDWKKGSIDLLCWDGQQFCFDTI
jgi:UDP-2,3-diacylglucosamine hydrolase